MIDRDILLKALAVKANRHAELGRQLEDPAVVVDHNKVRVISREMGGLRDFAKIHGDIVDVRKGLADAREMLALGDPDMTELANAEIKALEPRLEELWPQAEAVLADKDELGDRGVILEIRGGVGGDEAAIFAGDLFDMYSHFCANHKLKVEVLDQSASEMGGFKEIVAQVTGHEAYNLLRLEGGVHRVQRVPKTETQGRIHTSTATVAVLPEAEEVDIDIDWDKDVREDKMRAGGPGGQKVNKTESAIRLTHLETGIAVHMQDEKSQHKNRARARQILAARVFDHFQSQVDAERASARKTMVGKADRSTKIRTYNFPQDRATDHRIEFSIFNMDEVMAGKIEPFHEKLRLAEREEKLKQLIADMQAKETG
jgi:peptide chain release factor 1